MARFKIIFQPIGKRGIIHSGQTILDAARVSGVGLASVCGGMGTCEECRVRLITGILTDPTMIEKAALGGEALNSGWRLACQSEPLSDVSLFIAPESLTVVQRLQIDGIESEIHPDPIVKIPGAHGLAVDIGTTKLATYLINLESGETVSKSGEMNPQIAFGEDIVSRIAFCERDPNGATKLQSMLMDTINKMLGQMCKETRVAAELVLEAVLVGNTAMHHLAAGLPTKQLGRSPFSPASYKPISILATTIGLALAPNSFVYLPPVIAGYVGADHLAMLVATGLGSSNRSTLGQNLVAIDIGTNTEIALRSNGKITCCSCASGPAFEGAHIKEGMRAAPGAIERARWSDGKILWQTIGDQAPVGICGSGILDILAALLDGNLIKPSGALMGGDHYRIVPAVETSINRDLTVTRKDIHEIQLAKSAIRAGIEVLLGNADLKAEDIDKFILAGAFGTYLDLQSAIRVGVFPSLPIGKFSQVGNAAGIGAKQMLISVNKRREAELLAKRLVYVELATSKMFMELFIKNLELH
jgi:uncharacterized 2Fe-2S/4Fe-4S cluster protein (DUF4445 family)